MLCPGLEQILKRQISKIVMAKLIDLSLCHEWSSRTNLSVVANHQNLPAPQERRQLGHIRLRGLIDDDQVNGS